MRKITLSDDFKRNRTSFEDTGINNFYMTLKRVLTGF